MARLQAIQARYPHLLTAVRGPGMLFALQFEPVVPPGLAKSRAELIGEFSGILGLRALHEAGIGACLALNAKRNVRLTPALNMPDDLFDDMWDRVERTAAINTDEWRMLIHTHLRAGVPGLRRCDAKRWR